MTDELGLLYSYTQQEQATSPHLSEYMREVAPDLSRIVATSPGRGRFVLAGLFLAYRACNHMGVALSSSEAANLSSPHRERLAGVEAHTGHRLAGTSHYLRLLGLSRIRILVPMFRPGRFLADFVRRTGPVNWST